MPKFHRTRRSSRTVLLENLESRMLLSTAHSSFSTKGLVTGFTTLSRRWHVAAVASPIAVVESNATAGAPSGYSPAQIRQAYGFNQVTFGSIQGDGTGQTIAIIDAFDNPNIAGDLAVFDLQFGLPAPPSFRKVSETGTSTLPAAAPPSTTSSWSIEESLDVEWAHAAAPGASIILVEGNSDGYDDLVSNGVNWARSQPGVSVISMSFGGAEFPTERQFDTFLKTPTGHAGITFVASTGDTQTGEYPAMSPTVLAVGGTALTLDANNNYAGETAWSGAGGGISSVESQPSFQKGIVTQSTGKRTIPDVAMDADPGTGVAVYDSYDFGSSPWAVIGGTSLAAPLWAGLTAVANQGRATLGLATLDGASGTLPILYNLPASDFHDITSGSNGNSAAVGYDLVTGIGSPLANNVIYGLMGSASISGTVFQDNFSDGIKTGADTAIAGATVFLDTNNNGILDTGTTTTASAAPTLTIPDQSNITSSINIAAAGLVSNITVTLNITHTHDADLSAFLMGPAGTQIELFGFGGISGQNVTNTTFSDQAGAVITSGAAPYTGTFRTQNGALADFDGKAAAGVWTLKVADGVVGNTGTLQSWSLSITTGADDVYTTTTDANGHYAFANLPLGAAYTVREVVPPNEIQTSLLPGAAIVTAPLLSNLTNQNFANFPTLFTTTTDTTSYYVSVDPTDTFLIIFAGTNPAADPGPLYQIPLAKLSALTFNLLGQNNVLVIDFANGSPLAAANINVNATALSNDELRIFGQNPSQLFTLTDTQDALASGGGAIVYQNLPTLTLQNSTTNYSGSLNALQNLNLDANETFNWT